MTLLRQIDLLTMWGLSAVGLCLILGLFTPLAALGGAAYLLGFYLSMPPWPGLPEGITEGHYRYVNKNLIEMLACLALASTPNGLWIGVDALLFGWIGRGRRLREAPGRGRAGGRTRPARTGRRVVAKDRRKFKIPLNPDRSDRPMLNLTPEQRALGRANAHEVIGSTRRDFLKAAAVAPAVGAFYFGYQPMGDKPPVKAASSAPATKVARP